MWAFWPYYQHTALASYIIRCVGVNERLIANGEGSYQESRGIVPGLLFCCEIEPTGLAFVTLSDQVLQMTLVRS